MQKSQSVLFVSFSFSPYVFFTVSKCLLCSHMHTYASCECAYFSLFYVLTFWQNLYFGFLKVLRCFHHSPVFAVTTLFY